MLVGVAEVGVWVGGGGGRGGVGGGGGGGVVEENKNKHTLSLFLLSSATPRPAFQKCGNYFNWRLPPITYNFHSELREYVW